MTTHVTVSGAEVPAWSTIGTLVGVDDEGNLIQFAGDHREVRHICEALEAGEEVECEVEDYLILGVIPAAEVRSDAVDH